MAAEWYFRVMGAEFGPVSATELVEHAADGKIRPDTEVRKGKGAWIPASRVANLQETSGRSLNRPPIGSGIFSARIRNSVSSASCATAGFRISAPDE